MNKVGVRQDSEKQLVENWNFSTLRAVDIFLRYDSPDSDFDGGGIRFQNGNKTSPKTINVLKVGRKNLRLQFIIGRKKNSKLSVTPIRLSEFVRKKYQFVITEFVKLIQKMVSRRFFMEFQEANNYSKRVGI